MRSKMAVVTAGMVAAVAAGAGAVPAVAAESPVFAPRPASQATIMVKLRDDSGAETAAFAREHDLEVVRRYPQIDWVELRAGHEVAPLMDTLEDEPEVLGTDAVVRGEHFGPAFTPRDPIFSAGGTFGDGTPLGWHLTKVNLPAAWDVVRGSSATTIGVIDSEFDTQNPDLQTKLKTGYNTRSGTAEYHTANVRSTDADLAGGQCPGIHGSHVAGIIAAATDNNKGTSGVSFDNLVLPIRSSFNFTKGGGSTDAQFVADATEAILYATGKVAAINMSFGTTRPHDPLRDAIAFAVSRGVTMVGSAGNDQESNQGAINYPAAYPGVIAVAATKPNDDIASFSSNGDYVDVAAPGDAVLSTWDGRCTNGSNVGQFGSDGVTLNAISGTSMSAPVVTGIVGLMKSVRPDLSPAEVEQLLVATTRDLGAAGKDPVFGAGLVDANRAVIAARDFQRPAAPGPGAAAGRAPGPAAVQPAKLTPPLIIDRTVPAPLARALGKLTYSRSSGKVALRVECAVACLGTAKGTSRGRNLGTVRFSLKAGARKTLVLKLSAKTKKALRRLAKGKKVGIALVVTTEGVDGRTLSVKRTVSVKP